MRTYTDRHGLKDLVRELLGIELDKAEQSSDWGADELSATQQALRRPRRAPPARAARAARRACWRARGGPQLAQACFDFLPTRAALDLAGWPDQDMFAH